MKLQYKNNQNIFDEVEAPLSHGGTLPLLQFHLYRNIPWLAHCFTTRYGGVSQGEFESLNLSYTRGDDKNCVDENYRRVAEAMGTDSAHIVCSDQTHTTNIRYVTEEDAGKGIIRPKDYTNVDGLITDVHGLLLGTFYADCVPLYFVDPVHHAIGLCHSGWRGTVARMGQAGVDAMCRQFGTRPEDLLCAIGPSICQDCYEISDDVAEKFIQAFPRHEEDILIDKHNGHQQLDLWEANRIVLTEAGILPEHLTVTNLCTCCNSKVLFSHRASHGHRGNLGAFMMIRE